ncbi:MAG: SpoIVB peptidase [Oscillospiraceae bacterium]
MRKAVKFFSIIINLFIVAVCVVAGHYFLKLPNEYYVTDGKPLELPSYFEIDASPVSGTLSSLTNISQQKSTTVRLKLFGMIPIKDVTVKTVDRPVLVPGGNPFGIKLLADGVMVIGSDDVDCASGAICPSVLAGIKIGDVIISVDGKKVLTNAEIGKIISSSNGKPIEIVLKRNSKDVKVTLTPAFSEKDGSYKAGIWVRDSTAGIGTVTFYNPETGEFGGLGHPVCDIDTGEIIPISSGDVVGVNISGVEKGAAGAPGELIGSFSTVYPIGSLSVNCPCGIFGSLDCAPNLSSPIPMALRQEITLGEATILTTISGNEPKEYKIEIEKIDLKESSSSKNMVIKITDPTLLELSGGIVQGMSGSPIIQGGKLVGAVTHVFVNDPTKGYGIFCDNMYEAVQSPQKAAA